MQLGMMGLGRMGGSMVSRLLRAEHECVVFDARAVAVQTLVRTGAVGAASIKQFVALLSKPRTIWLMLPAGAVDAALDELLPCLEAGDVLVDGHNRYGICQKHGIAFNTVQNTHFKTLDDVHLWMIEQHLGRRSVSDFQRGVLALRKKDILAARRQLPREPAPAAKGDEPVADLQPWESEAEPMVTRESMAKAARVSSATIQQIEKIQKSATPELVEAVKAGTISINAAATVASLPAQEQVAAAAGGKKELQQAARQVRNAQAVARTAPESTEGTIARLKQTVEELKMENAALKAKLAELGA